MTRNTAEQARELIAAVEASSKVLLQLITKLSAFTDILEAEAEALSPQVQQGEVAHGDGER